ncbi:MULTISPECIES: hypothetical protein [Terrabacteria group]|uniref:hypothetical protein n=1 Tax=Bacillati TaxID=1783272 RepID=UPI001939ADD8|nr:MULTISPECIES: hypothetical protein [Terrabacteria group]MBW9212030.1 hypothetical protein [Trueperella sp. zg.1013]QRG87163.1 hypothetical protein JOS54_02315 [Bulleidia sp. zg-1006]
MEIQHQQNFKLKVDFEKSESDDFSLRFFYGPLLENSLALYETLYAFKLLNKPLFSFGFLMAFSKVDVYAMDKTLAKLEQYSLLRIYESKDGSYLLELLRPLYPSEFLKEKVFVDDLKWHLAEDKYQELMVSVPYQTISLDGYQEITRISSHPFQLEKEAVKKENPLIPKNIAAYMNRVKPLIFPIQWRTKKVLEALSVIQNGFQFNYKELDKLVNQATHRYDEEDKIIRHLYQSANHFDAPKKTYNHLYELAPVAFYRELQRRQPNSVEKDVIIQFVKEMQASNEVMNTIIEWVIGQIQDLNLKYLLKVGTSALNRHLEKREDILAYLNQKKEKPIPKRPEKVVFQAKHLKEEKVEEDTNFDIETLKKQLERGKF